MFNVPADGKYSSSTQDLTLAGGDTVSLSNTELSITPTGLDFGRNSVSGANGNYDIELTGGADTVSVGDGNSVIRTASGISAPQDTEIVVGGIQGFSDLSDPSNTTELLATGRVSLYLHWAALIDPAGEAANVSGSAATGPEATIAQIHEIETVFTGTPDLAELNFDSNPGTYFSGLYNAEYPSLGFNPSSANINIFDLWETPGGFQSWVAYVNVARSLGMTTVAPVFSPNGETSTCYWADPQFDSLRQMAIYGGGISIDAPPSFFFAVSSAYRQYTVDEIKWGVAHGLRVSVIVSPYSGNNTFLQDTKNFVNFLVASGAVPTQWVVENYDVNVGSKYPNVLGSELQSNTVDNVALWLAENAPTAQHVTSGNNVITVGNGNNVIDLSPYDTLSAGRGNDTVTSGGWGSIAIGGGTGQIALNTSDKASISGGSYFVSLGTADAVTINGGQTTLSGSSTPNLTTATNFVDVAAGSATVIPRAQPVDITAGNSKITAVVGSGGGTVQGGSMGGNIIVATTGETTIDGGGRADTIVGGSNNTVINTSSMGGDVVVAGAGPTFLTLHDHDVVFGGSGPVMLTTANYDTIVAGSGQISNNLEGTGNVVWLPEDLNEKINFQGGNNTVVGCGGADTIDGGAGFSVICAGGNSLLAAGSGGGVLFAASGNTTLLGGSGNVTMVGTTGSTLINAQSSNALIWGGSGNAQISTGTGHSIVVLATGQDTVHFGTGVSTVSAGTGNENFDISGIGSADDVIINFKLSSDTITFGQGETIKSEDYEWGGAVIHLNTGGSVIIYGTGIDASHLPTFV